MPRIRRGCLWGITSPVVPTWWRFFHIIELKQPPRQVEYFGGEKLELGTPPFSLLAKIIPLTVVIGQDRPPFIPAKNRPIWKVSHNTTSGQIMIFHQPRFPWNKGISLTKPQFRVRSHNLTRLLRGPIWLLTTYPTWDDPPNQKCTKLPSFSSAEVQLWRRDHDLHTDHLGTNPRIGTQDLK